MMVSLTDPDCWHISTFFNIIGAILNLFILYSFYADRNYYHTAINVFTWLEALRRTQYCVFTAPWRNYLIYTGSGHQETEKVRNMEFECSLLHAIMVHGNLSENLYVAIIALTRFLLVSGTMELKFQRILNGKKSLFKIILLLEGLLLIVFFQCFYNENESNTFGFLRNICLKAWNQSPEKFQESFNLMKFNSLLMLILMFSNIITVVSYFRLFIFLKNQTATNSALHDLELIKAKRRNILPARIGIVHVAVITFISVCYYLFYFFMSNQPLEIRLFAVAMMQDSVQMSSVSLFETFLRKSKFFGCSWR